MSQLIHKHPTFGLQEDYKNSLGPAKTYAGSGLPQGPFLENNLFALKVGLRWVLSMG